MIDLTNAKAELEALQLQRATAVTVRDSRPIRSQDWFVADAMIDDIQANIRQLIKDVRADTTR